MISSVRGTVLAAVGTTAIIEVGGVGLSVNLTPQHALSLRVGHETSVRTVMGTAQASGVALHLAASRGLSVGLHTPSEVKAAVTGYGSADKRQVGSMVARVLRLEKIPGPADAADALAIALCHAWKGPARSGAASSLTPAQEAWRLAEKSAAARRLSS